MTGTDAAFSSADLMWTAFGVLAGIIFYSRFYVQWIYSEIQKRSVVPPLFWYQSALGSVMLLTFAVHSQSPLGALSQSVNLVPYARNLIHIWRDQGRLTARLNVATHVFVSAVAAAGLAVVAWLWLREYRLTQGVTSEEARQTWIWLAVGVTGQGLFASRFIIQWIATERQKKSVVPTLFWYISIVAAVLQCLTYFQRGDGELVYAVGLVATMLVYARNIWMIHRGPQSPEEKGDAS
jgi:lipid-A-disaccharide synthase-like uncharacterized protein